MNMEVLINRSLVDAWRAVFFLGPGKLFKLSASHVDIHLSWLLIFLRRMLKTWGCLRMST